VHKNKDKFVTDWFYVPCASQKKLQRTGFLGLGDPKIVKDYVNNVPDLDDYAAKLAESYNKLDSAGYEVINIVPINIGSSDQCFQENKNYVGDVGYSITRGAVVVGKLKSEGNDK
jgi:hypothetical protein